MNIKPQTGRRNYAKGGIVDSAIAEEGNEELKQQLDNLRGYPEAQEQLREESSLVNSLVRRALHKN